MFRKNLTKWHVLATYNQSGNDYVVFFRKNLKTGMMYFKTKSASNRLHCAYNMAGKSFVSIEETFKMVLAL